MPTVNAVLCVIGPFHVFPIFLSSILAKTCVANLMNDVPRLRMIGSYRRHGYTQIISNYPKFFVSGPLVSTLHRIGNNVILDRYTTWSIANGPFGFLAWLANDLPTLRSLPPEYPGYEMSTCIEIP